MRLRLSTKRKLSLVKEFEKSDLNITNFCKQRNINGKSFYRWRKALKLQQQRNTKIKFKPISILTSELKVNNSTSIQILALGGIKMVLSENIDSDNLMKILTCLRVNTHA